MTPETKEEFKNKAKSWINENHDSIEMNCAFVPNEAIPEDEEYPNMWVFENGSQCDASIGYEMIDLKSDRGEPAVALIFVKETHGKTSTSTSRIYLKIQTKRKST